MKNSLFSFQYIQKRTHDKKTTFSSEIIFFISENLSGRIGIFSIFLVWNQ